MPATSSPASPPAPSPEATVASAAVAPPPKAPARVRPPGEQGGHTVQEWEQPAPGSFTPPSSTSRDTPAPTLVEEVTGLAPAADTVPAVVKSTAVKAAPAPVVPGAAPVVAQPVPQPASTAKAVAPAGSNPEQTRLVEALTASLVGMFGRAIHDSVVAAVRDAMATPRSGAAPQTAPKNPAGPVETVPSAEPAKSAEAAGPQ